MPADFKHLPLGTRIPNSPHGVSVSLPNLADVIAYEEKEPRTMAKVCSGYPRFVRHPFLVEMAQHWITEHPEHQDRQPLFFATPSAMEEALRRSATQNRFNTFTCGEIPMVLADPSDPATLKLTKYLQHTGTGVSSREAEDALIRLGKRKDRFAEHAPATTARQAADALESWLAPSVPSQIHSCRSGMNAFYAAFEAINALQRPRGRRDWVSVGWLYLDTLEILNHFLPIGGKHHAWAKPGETDSLLAFLESEGQSIAGIVIEAPNNPLVHTGDILRISEACRRLGITVVLDPSLVSPANVDLSPWCDVLVCSLTKYAAHHGDVMIGALSVRTDTSMGCDLAAILPTWICPPYNRDLNRLVASLSDARTVLEKINQNTCALAKVFEKHPAIARTHWPLMAGQSDHYKAVSRGEGNVGGVITLNLKRDLARFYDRLPLPKGPSFGTTFTLVCAYVHLAHYDLMLTPEGRARMAHAGLSDRMVRLSIGTEDPADLESTFLDALK